MRFAIVNDLRIAQEILRHAVAQIPGASVAVSGIFEHGQLVIEPWLDDPMLDYDCEI
jgi:hypothetical protein